MTEEERAQRSLTARILMNAAPEPSLETRIGWLEADASAQRTAILKLRREIRHHRVALWVLAPYLAALALAVLT
jgi:hypothetical protein